MFWIRRGYRNYGFLRIGFSMIFDRAIFLIRTISWCRQVVVSYPLSDTMLRTGGWSSARHFPALLHTSQDWCKRLRIMSTHHITSRITQQFSHTFLHFQFVIFELGIYFEMYLGLMDSWDLISWDLPPASSALTDSLLISPDFPWQMYHLDYI